MADVEEVETKGPNGEKQRKRRISVSVRMIAVIMIGLIIMLFGTLYFLSSRGDIKVETNGDGNSSIAIDKSAPSADDASLSEIKVFIDNKVEELRADLDLLTDQELRDSLENLIAMNERFSDRAQILIERYEELDSMSDEDKISFQEDIAEFIYDYNGYRNVNFSSLSKGLIARQRITELERKNEQLRRERDRLVAAFRRGEISDNEYQTELQRMQADSSYMAQKYSLAQAEIDDLHAEIERLKAQVAALNGQLDSTLPVHISKLSFDVLDAKRNRKGKLIVRRKDNKITLSFTAKENYSGASKTVKLQILVHPPIGTKFKETYDIQLNEPFVLGLSLDDLGISGNTFPSGLYAVYIIEEGKEQKDHVIKKDFQIR